MNGAFYIGATGLHAQERALNTVSNNIANLNTPAFKRSEVRFSEMMAPPRALENLPPLSGPLDMVMSGVTAETSARIFTQGDLKQTGKPLDIAVSGSGFIELLGADGRTLLWRGGTLKVNDDGFLAEAGGLPLKAMISVPDDATELVIDRDGGVHALIDGDTDPQDIGRIELTLVRDAAGLSPVEGGLYVPAVENEQASVLPGEEGAGTIVQGSIEASNVNLSDEVVTLLLMQRAYAANAQLVQAGDQLMAIANGLRR